MTEDDTLRQAEQMYIRYRETIFRMCLLYLKDAGAAEDAMQETFLRAWKKRGSFRGESSEKTWLTAIAVNVCRDCLRLAWLRRERKCLPLEAVLQKASADGVSQKDLDVVAAVGRLPVKLREAIILRYYQGERLAEIADMLSLSVSGVNARLAKAKKRLGEELREVYFDE